jgi:hypothetical protein
MMQLQSLVIQDPLRFGISGKENLESPIQEEPLNPVCPHPSPDCVRGFDKEKGNPAFLKFQGAAQTGQSASDNDHFGFPFHSVLPLNQFFINLLTDSQG